MDGSSQVAHVTQYSRGTDCYRAPELIVGTDCTNKVDMWAIGCILYELVFWRKAFDSDYDARRYAESGSDFKVPLEINGKISAQTQMEFIERTIRELLKADNSERPSARSLYERFVSLKSGASGDEVMSTITPVVPSASNPEILGSSFQQAPSSTDPGPKSEDVSPQSSKAAPSVPPKATGLSPLFINLNAGKRAARASAGSSSKQATSSPTSTSGNPDQSPIAPSHPSLVVDAYPDADSPKNIQTTLITEVQPLFGAEEPTASTTLGSSGNVDYIRRKYS
jgi:Protein kinase domain